jgi:hypothetical protein
MRSAGSNLPASVPRPLFFKINGTLLFLFCPISSSKKTIKLNNPSKGGIGMKKATLFAGMALLAMTAFSHAQETKKTALSPNNDNLIQIAILLDASNSMDGLIDQAKTQLWKIVNEMALAKRNGKSPRLEVAFYEYGKSSVSQAQGYIRQIVPLSTDLDKISDELFKLTTNGGSEYCGQVIDRAAKELAWNPGSNVMKAIFVAGNEPFTQGSTDYRKSCKETIAKGIVINTIFCGTAQEGINTNWKDGADCADGSYMSIDQNQAVVHINAPQDSLITALGDKLNTTYIGYGAGGAARKEMQYRQDKLTKSAAPAAMVQRSVAKSSAGYANAEWDLVDAKKEKKLEVSQLREEQLPEEMKKMSVKERETYVETKSKERADLQAQIGKLNDERRKYVAEEQKKLKLDNTLDQAIVNSVRKQATTKGFIFETK